MILIPLIAVLAISVAKCNRFASEMLFLSSFNYYNAYTEPIGFVRQLDLVANNYLTLVKKIDKGLDMELKEASYYDLKSSSSSINLQAAEVINKMQSRQIIVDFLLYQIHYCHKMYSTATAKFLGQKMVPLYKDLNFESKMSRMIMYEWVNQMSKMLLQISDIYEKTSEVWKTLREEINTTALGGPVQRSANSATDGGSAPTTDKTTGSDQSANPTETKDTKPDDSDKPSE
ncbi:conserved hypothetical protein [Theileria orientalis strain Shintoku]|uniref:Uncharacterized protein n=1 Tax=Theileria orientalis strain Shintoku TaxID=869250 RepID=J4D6K5_THEOR|nr:conserved hypothetical protein [Theileria orientalis strain Shintoku]PVC49592.1 hypothetical protein MACL_00002948 [Theileria orientalis]BAM39635.1 conserved hypothetical protein [Theileria orientalis strain Shintoku]|eukprot:XP_009689936.1 conserved hypothetical protein [Theileria orientalis strain Shintoku]